jgi:hypothetical protein
MMFYLHTVSISSREMVSRSADNPEKQILDATFIISGNDLR